MDNIAQVLLHSVLECTAHRAVQVEPFEMNVSLAKILTLYSS